MADKSKMPRDYRVVRRECGKAPDGSAMYEFGIFEVTYDFRLNPLGRSAEPAGIKSETIEGVSRGVKQFLRALEEPWLTDEIFPEVDAADDDSSALEEAGYRFKDGIVCGMSATEWVRLTRRLQREMGRPLTVDDIVYLSHDQLSPLHAEFRWDAPISVLAHEWRLFRARELFDPLKNPERTSPISAAKRDEIRAMLKFNLGREPTPEDIVAAGHNKLSPLYPVFRWVNEDQQLAEEWRRQHAIELLEGVIEETSDH